MPLDGNEIVGDALESSQAPVLVEEKAKAKGWKPRDESDLPEEQWVDAKEFLGRQPLYDQIHALKKDIAKQGQAFKKDMAAISKHFAEQAKVEYDKAVKQLKAEKALAIEENDIGAVDAINEELAEKKKEFEAVKAETPSTNADSTAEFEQWRKDNKWFNEDLELQKEAIALGTGYAIANPNLPQASVLEYVEQRIKKIYSEKFEPKKEKTKVSDSQVESGGITPNSGVSSKRSKSLTENDLSEQELSVMKTLIKRGALKDKATKNKISEKEQYFRDLAEAKGLN